MWDVPGGHCEPGEPPEQALVRELQEELGVTPTAWRPLGEFRPPPGDRQAEPLVLHLYAVTAWEGTPHNRQPAEHAEIAWFDLDEACRLDLAHPSYPALFRPGRAAGLTDPAPHEPSAGDRLRGDVAVSGVPSRAGLCSATRTRGDRPMTIGYVV